MTKNNTTPIERLRVIKSAKPIGKAVVVVGAQWGDEGKGRITDLLAKDSKYVARFQGGPNAGHTLEVEGEKTILHQIPSGALYKHANVILGEGMVLNPRTTKEELNSLPEDLGLEDRLYISADTNVITPIHPWADTNHEKTGKGVGSTRKGIRPAYEDRAGRRAVTFGDVLNNPELARRMLEKQVNHWGYEEQTVDELFDIIQRDVNKLADHVTDTSEMLTDALERGENVLFEAAQGAKLDVTRGTYPCVTSSSTGANGVSSGAGVPPAVIQEVIGVVKLVETRVGDGSFPTELVNEDLQKEQFMAQVYAQHDLIEDGFNLLGPELQNKLRKETTFTLPEHYQFVIDNLEEAKQVTAGEVIEDRALEGSLSSILGEDKQATYNHILGMHLMVEANEYGATSGRPRRIGHVDPIAIKHFAKRDGYTGLCLTKLDCLGDLDEISMVVGYEVDGERFEGYPIRSLGDEHEVVPVLETFKGFSKQEVIDARNFEDLPENAQYFVARLCEIAQVRPYAIGVGPGRDEVIEMHNPFTGESVYDQEAA